MIKLKSASEIKKMEAAGAVVASVFEAVKDFIKPGVSTYEIDRIASECIRSAGGKASFLGYGNPPFPATICISINEEIVHGIPSKTRIMQDGDIVSVDVGCIIEGYHGDAARTFCCGNVSRELQDLIRVTEESFWLGVSMAKPGNRIGDISAAVQSHCEAHGYGVVRELTGHGVGQSLHEEPDLPNYGKAGRGLRLVEGMTLALEPMITLGDYRTRVLDDEWTWVTIDGKAAAHYENSFAILADGPLILTCPERSRP